MFNQSEKQATIPMVWGILTVIVVLSLVFINVSGWKIEDDEGTGLYAIWRFASDEIPYVDFASTKAPLYLLFGRALVSLWGRNLFLLRITATITIVSGVSALAYAISLFEGWKKSLIFWAFTLLTPEVYHLARMFRSDSLMLGLLFWALAALLMYSKYPHRAWLIGSAILFGLALLMKVVAVMSFIGAVGWLLAKTLQKRDRLAGGLDVILFVVVAGGIAVSGYLVAEVYAPGAVTYVISSPGAHTTSTLRRFLKGLVGWATFLKQNPGLFFGFPLFLMRLFYQRKQDELIWFTQILGCLPFFMISGSPYPRYLAYLVPSLVIMFIYGIQRINIAVPIKCHSHVLLIFLVLALILAFPSRLLLLRKETDTSDLAAWVERHTDVDAVVVSDYAALNFHAGRKSVYSQGVVSHGWATTGLITGSMLIQQMERDNASVVLLHVHGGAKPPEHLYYLRDYGVFYNYVKRHFNLTRTWDRSGQLIEIWQR